ncbi:MAG TPA: efflux RND transporter periplasmic adaptor subunit [Rhizomicrobium sp.]|nr:efflux RND transporter periplasmic adaptor subunit [Rhizomicrobium sp.]
MATLDLAQAQNFLRQRANEPGRRLRRQATGAALFLLLGGGYALYHAANAKPAAPEGVSAAAPVTIETLKPHTVRPFAEFSGRIDAVDYAEIRPQVTGRITEIRFKDGQQVKAGDILFVIDPRPYQAEAAKASADLATAQTNAALAHTNLVRYDTLRRQNAIAGLTYDQSVNADGVAQAAIKSAKAALAAAQVNVDYAFIRAPISGKVSRAEITVGNLVGSSTVAPQLLASIVSNDGVYADFEVDEQTYLNILRQRGPNKDQAISVDLTVQGDAQAKIYHGAIESFDNRINSGSGTIRARARFANEDGSLVPGMFVSVRMGSGVLPNTLLVPETAIGNDQSKRFVYVVGAGDKAEYREVALGTTLDGERVVASGLKAGDRVILDGLQKLAPGAAVAPHGVQTASN